MGARSCFSPRFCPQHTPFVEILDCNFDSNKSCRWTNRVNFAVFLWNNVRRNPNEKKKRVWSSTSILRWIFIRYRAKMFFRIGRENERLLRVYRLFIFASVFCEIITAAHIHKYESRWTGLQSFFFIVIRVYWNNANTAVRIRRIEYEPHGWIAQCAYNFRIFN